MLTFFGSQEFCDVFAEVLVAIFFALVRGFRISYLEGFETVLVVRESLTPLSSYKWEVVDGRVFLEG